MTPEERMDRIEAKMDKIISFFGIDAPRKVTKKAMRKFSLRKQILKIK